MGVCFQVCVCLCLNGGVHACVCVFLCHGVNFSSDVIIDHLIHQSLWSAICFPSLC